MVERVGYLGNLLSCEILAGGMRLRADLPAHSRMRPGASVHLRIDPSDITLVPDAAIPSS
jgi:hypothetical protein